MGGAGSQGCSSYSSKVNSNATVIFSEMAVQMDLIDFGHSSSPSKVAFGSVEARKMFPIHTIPTRMGIEQGLRGAPQRGPGRYDPDPVSLFLRPMTLRPRSTRGWYFGATSAQRQPKQTKGIKPGPADYQEVSYDNPKSMYKPFGSDQTRLPTDNKNKGKLGPGSYKHDVPVSRHVEYKESFGGKRTLQGIVTIKCTKGIPDKCEECKKEPIGDYYENQQYALCPDCYKQLQESTPVSMKNNLQNFYKVRDCRGVHKHEFPGKDPKIIIKTEKEQRKLRLKEAYLRLYYS